MAKVFRIHKGQDGKGWFPSKTIDKNHLESIITDGKEVATSIPSPFARIDLVKSAFKWVADHEIRGETAQHKLVSDTLDVAQLFYSSKKFSNIVEITAWNPNERFSDLIKNDGSKHSKFAETLKLYWEQDSKIDNQKEASLYNFELVKNLYFILNKNTKQVIGGTSPATLFFASPDVSSAIKELELRIGQDKLFDDSYASLAEREKSFVEYMYALLKQPSFNIYFPELYSYMERIRKEELDSDLQTLVSNYTYDEISKYPPCPVLDNENNPCDFLGIKLGVRYINGENIENDSDFVIKADFKIAGLQPLILPNDKFSKEWTYTTKGIQWDANTPIPYINKENLKNSVLPLQHDRYPWLTIGNFLEDKIVELPYPIDQTKFQTCGLKRHLLPLKPLFFKYFNSEKVSDYLTCEELAGGTISVELRVPVKRGEIIFKKKYTALDQNIEKQIIHLAIFPFFRIKESDIPYKIGLLDDRIDPKEDLKIHCFEKGSVSDIAPAIVRNPGFGGELKSQYYKTEEPFDSVKLFTQSWSGFIIPLFNRPAGNSVIRFAIDFGTTNTHIEYRYGDHGEVPFSNDQGLPLWQSLLDRNKSGIDPENLEREITFDQEILPFNISKDDNQIAFPLRTALVHNKQINYNESIDLIRQANNYLLLEHLPIRGGYLELNTELKWSNYSEIIDEKKVESYIEYLITLVFYKTLLLGGNPTFAKITWFYPVSMDQAELGVFHKLWKSVYKKVFKQNSDESNIIGIPESIAPYLYYKSNNAGLSLSIDIGGGSSDIAVFDETDINAKLISSFKFAGNAIFGDGYPSGAAKSNSDNNGYVITFKDSAMNSLKGKNHELKIAVLNFILKNRKNSADFSSFLFALEKDKSIQFSYTRLLQKNKRLKLPILIFYGAIAYYSANLLFRSGIGIPKHILLSGTAAKTVALIDSSTELKNIAELFEFFYEKIYSKEISKEIKVVLSSIPKEITCKGALQEDFHQKDLSVPVNFWIGGLDDNKGLGVFDKNKDVKKTPKYNQLDNVLKTEIERSVNHFFDLIDEYVGGIRLEGKYIIEQSAYDVFKNTRSDSIESYLIRGIKSFHKKESDYIEETLFFYPLIGILNRLAFNLSKKDNRNEAK